MTDDLESWKTDARALPRVYKALEQGDNMADMQVDRQTLYNYFDRPIADTRIIGEILSEKAIYVNGWNLTREVVDTAVAVICRDVSVSVLPVGADGTQAQNCEQLTRLSDGIDDIVKFKRKAIRVARTAMLCRFGVLKGFIQANGEIGCDWVNPMNTCVRYGNDVEVPEVFEARAVPRAIAKKLYPRSAAGIANAPSSREDPISGVEPSTYRSADSIRIYEAVSPKIGDQPGKHIIALEDGTVLNPSKTTWDMEIVPYVFMTWMPSWRGVAGKSLASIIMAQHRQYNQIIANILACARGCVSRVWIRDDEELAQMSDFPLEVSEYNSPTPPKTEVINSIPTQLFDMLERTRAQAFRMAGVSENMANGSRPQGLNSEPSQLTFLEIANVRAFEPQTRWQDFHADWMRLKMALANKAYKDKEVRVMAPGTKTLELIKWPKDFKEDQYVYRATLASGLPLTMSGKLQALQHIRSLAPSAFTDGDMVRAIGMPDVEATRDLVNANRDLAQSMVDDCLQRGIATIPSEIQGVDGLETFIRIGSQSWSREQVFKQYPEANSELLRRSILHAKERMGQMSNQGMPQQSPPPAPMPAPTVPIAAAPTPATPVLNQQGV